MRSHARVFLVGTPLLVLAAVTFLVLDSAAEGSAERARQGTSGRVGDQGFTSAHGQARPASCRRLDGGLAAFSLKSPTSLASFEDNKTTSGRTRDVGDAPHARELTATSQRPAAPMLSRPHETHVPDGAELARIRSALRSPDARVRLDALREARDLRSSELTPDIVLLLRSETDVPVRRLATQVLAQGDPATIVEVLQSLKQDKDPIVQANAAFGLARSGDEGEQTWLLGLCEATRQHSPGLLPVVAAALEDSALKAPAVIERFTQLAQNPRVSQATRDRATQVLKAKLGS